MPSSVCAILGACPIPRRTDSRRQPVLDYERRTGKVIAKKDQRLFPQQLVFAQAVPAILDGFGTGLRIIVRRIN